MIADELISFLLEKYKRESNNDNLKEVLDTNLNDEDSKIADLYINLSKANEPKDINKWADEILKMYPDDIDVQFSKIIANFVSAKDFKEKILKLENKYKDEFYKINNISEAFLENKPLNLFENVANRPYLRLLVQIGLTSFYNHDTEQAYEYFTKVYNFAPNLIEQFSLQYGLACVAFNKEDRLNKIYEILPNNYGLRLSHAINTFLKDHKLEALKSELDELNPYLSIIFSRGLDISEDDFNYCCSLNPYLKGSITEAIHTYNDIFMLCDGKICNEIVDAFDKSNPPSTILDLFNENATDVEQNNSNRNENEVHLQIGTGIAERERGHEPRQDEPVGTGAEAQAERPDGRGVDRRDTAYSRSDEERGRSVSRTPIYPATTRLTR